jgi:hypothetical protein
MIKSSTGNTSIFLFITENGTAMFRISGKCPSKLRTNIYDALSDYGVGYDTAKSIVKLFLKAQLPKIKVHLLEADFKGHEYKKATKDE